MPELPEVETIRRDLELEAVGKEIVSVEIEGARTVRRHDPAILLDKIRSQRVEQIRRIGKFLLIDLQFDDTLGIHLRMSGQLLWVRKPDVEVAKHTHARVFFDTGEELRFLDPRTFGELWVTNPSNPELAHLGPDAFEDLTKEVLRNQIAGRRQNLKALLLNQEVMAGIGNIYSDEILWWAKLRHDRTPDGLSQSDYLHLHRAIGRVLSDAVLARGSSLSDKQYVDVYGMAGSAQRKHRVYARAGQPCFRCQTAIERTKVAGRSTHFCPKCQR